MCIICPHTYGWCHVVYCGGCAEVQCVFCQTGPWFVCCMSPYIRLVSCCVLWGMCRSSVCLLPNWTMVCVLYVPILTAGVMLCIVGDVQKFSVSFAKLDHGLCVVCPHTYGWCHVVYCGGCAEVQCVFCQTGLWFVYHMSPYLRLVSCCVLWGMCRSSVCLLPNWAMVCVSYVPILTAGVMLCIVGDVQKFSVSFAKLDHGLCVICPHTYGWCHVVYCGGCAEVQCVFCLTGPWFVCHMALFHCMVRHGTVQFGSLLGGFPLGTVLDYGLCIICTHTYGWCHVVYCGGSAEVHWTMVYVFYVLILTAGVILCITV